MEKLGLPPIVRQLCDREKGLILVTGPTGSGKSTTLASMVDYLNNTFEGHILTIEDPVEFVHKSKKCLVNQRELGVHTLSFANALRAALREDPDIILVGEMRDLETIQLALTAAETGHLVFGTLHTSSAPKTIDRIIDAFPPNQQSQIRTQIAEALEAVITQTLLKKKSGGRVAALEIMVATTAVRNLVREGKLHQIPGIMQASQKDGMQTMDMALFELATRGVVTKGEAQSRSMNPNLFGSRNERRSLEFLKYLAAETGVEMDVRSLLKVMVDQEASDLYLTVDSAPAYRVHGSTQQTNAPPFTNEQLEALALALMRGQQRGEFEEKMEMNLALYYKELGRFRVNIFRQRGNVGLVFRHIKAEIQTVEQLGLPLIVKDISMTKRGLVLVVGATGSGKSTTLAAMIDHRNTIHPGHIVTVEDPIEFVHNHKRSLITQREVGFDTLSFQNALKNTLRQAPDVILDRRSSGHGNDGSRDHLRRNWAPLHWHPPLKQCEPSHRAHHELFPGRAACTDLPPIVAQSSRHHLTTAHTIHRRETSPCAGNHARHAPH